MKNMVLLTQNISKNMRFTYITQIGRNRVSGLFILFLGILISCSHAGTEEGSWVCSVTANKSQIVQFKGNDVMVETLILDDSVLHPSDERRWYTIEDKLVDDSNSNIALYILKTNVKEGKHPHFSVLGVVTIDDHTKKFYTGYLDVIHKDSKQEIMEKLNRPMFGNTGKYVAFRDISKAENIFKKEASGNTKF